MEPLPAFRKAYFALAIALTLSPFTAYASKREKSLTRNGPVYFLKSLLLFVL